LNLCRARIMVIGAVFGDNLCCPLFCEGHVSTFLHYAKCWDTRWWEQRSKRKAINTTCLL
jgi:hypothetical protein